MSFDVLECMKEPTISMHLIRVLAEFSTRYPLHAPELATFRLSHKPKVVLSLKDVEDL